MKIPLVVLAAGAVLAGFIPFGHFVSSDGHALPSEMDLAFSCVPVLLALADCTRTHHVPQAK
jgi:NADH-quinone oxidoreductase subunit L